MHAAILVSNIYSALAIFVLFLHTLFIVWVIFGALLTRSHPILRWLHISSVVWGVLTELLPWPCPLTVLESCLERGAGVELEQGGFLLYYLDKLVYPDISPATLTTAAVLICALNLAFYGWQARIARLRWQLHNAGSDNSIDCGVECGDAKNGSTSRLDKAGLDVSLGCRARSTTITSDGAFFVNQRRAGLFWRFHHS